TSTAPRVPTGEMALGTAESNNPDRAREGPCNPVEALNSMKTLKAPFFCPVLGEQEVTEVVATLHSGWLTTGPRSRRFEQEFAAAVGAAHAVAVSSCTAALHLALEAIGL